MLQKISDRRINILFMQFYNHPNGTQVVCAGGQHGELFLGFYDKGKKGYMRVYSAVMNVCFCFLQRVRKYGPTVYERLAPSHPS